MTMEEKIALFAGVIPGAVSLIVLAFVFIAVHAVVMAARRSGDKPSSEGTKLQRHAPIDRAFHWVMAVSVFVLLITGVLPIIGIEFSWLTIHWIH